MLKYNTNTNTTIQLLILICISTCVCLCAIICCYLRSTIKINDNEGYGENRKKVPKPKTSPKLINVESHSHHQNDPTSPSQDNPLPIAQILELERKAKQNRMSKKAWVRGNYADSIDIKQNRFDSIDANMILTEHNTGTGGTTIALFPYKSGIMDGEESETSVDDDDDDLDEFQYPSSPRKQSKSQHRRHINSNINMNEELKEELNRYDIDEDNPETTTDNDIDGTVIVNYNSNKSSDIPTIDTMSVSNHSRHGRHVYSPESINISSLRINDDNIEIFSSEDEHEHKDKIDSDNDNIPDFEHEDEKMSVEMSTITDRVSDGGQEDSISDKPCADKFVIADHKSQSPSNSRSNPHSPRHSRNIHNKHPKKKRRRKTTSHLNTIKEREQMIENNPVLQQMKQDILRKRERRKKRKNKNKNKLKNRQKDKEYKIVVEEVNLSKKNKVKQKEEIEVVVNMDLIWNLMVIGIYDLQSQTYQHMVYH